MVASGGADQAFFTPSPKFITVHIAPGISPVTICSEWFAPEKIPEVIASIIAPMP